MCVPVCVWMCERGVHACVVCVRVCAWCACVWCVCVMHLGEYV